MYNSIKKIIKKKILNASLDGFTSCFLLLENILGNLTKKIGEISSLPTGITDYFSITPKIDKKSHTFDQFRSFLNISHFGVEL